TPTVSQFPRSPNPTKTGEARDRRMSNHQREQCPSGENATAFTALESANERSSLPVATSTKVSLSVSAVRPSGENATDLPPGVSVRSSLPVVTSQSRRGLPDSAVRPSGENATDWTVCDCPVKARIGLPVATSHSLSTASSPSDDQLPDNALRPSREKATDVTEAKCAHCACGSELDSPVRRTIAGSQKLRSRLPVAMSHSVTLLELPPDSAVRPSGEKATVLTARLS